MLLLVLLLVEVIVVAVGGGYLSIFEDIIPHIFILYNPVYYK